jgi:hypothetical protein
MSKSAKQAKTPEEKFNAITAGKSYNPYNNTGNYLIKDGPSVSPKERVNIYLDIYKSKINQEDQNVPYGFYIKEHSEPNLKGLFFNIVIPDWVDTKYPEIKGSLTKLGSLTVGELHDTNKVKRIEYIDMIDTNNEQNPEICEIISKNEEKEAQTKLLQKKKENLEKEIENLEKEIKEKEQPNAKIEKEMEINHNYNEKKSLQSKLEETKKRLQMLQDDLQKIKQQLANIDTFQWSTDNKRMLITPKFTSLVDTDHPSKVCNNYLKRNKYWDQPLFEKTNDWESTWFKTEQDETIQFKYELEKLNKMYCKSKTQNEKTCTSSKPKYSSVKQLCNFQPGTFYNGCEINPEKAKTLVKEREKLYDGCMYTLSCQTDAGVENGMPKFYRPYMKKFFSTGNKDIPICCKRSFSAAAKYVLTMKRLEKYGYRPTAVFREEIQQKIKETNTSETTIPDDIINVLIHHHSDDEKNVKERIEKENQFFDNDNAMISKDMADIVIEKLNLDQAIDTLCAHLTEHGKKDEDAENLLDAAIKSSNIEDERTWWQELANIVKGTTSAVIKGVKKAGEYVLKKIIPIIKTCVKFMFLRCASFSLILKKFGDQIVSALSSVTSGFLFYDEYNKFMDIWNNSPQCLDSCENKFNEEFYKLISEYPKAHSRYETKLYADANQSLSVATNDVTTPTYTRLDENEDILEKLFKAREDAERNAHAASFVESQHRQGVSSLDGETTWLGTKKDEADYLYDQSRDDAPTAAASAKVKTETEAENDKATAEAEAAIKKNDDYYIKKRKQIEKAKADCKLNCDKHSFLKRYLGEAPTPPLPFFHSNTPPAAAFPGYGVPLPEYGVPHSGYGAPPPGVPPSEYGVPPSEYGAPPPPNLDFLFSDSLPPVPPAPGYGGVPPSEYGAPPPPNLDFLFSDSLPPVSHTGYGGAPAPYPGAPPSPSSAFLDSNSLPPVPPAPGYGAPVPGYGAPVPGASPYGYGAPLPGTYNKKKGFVQQSIDTIAKLGLNDDKTTKRLEDFTSSLYKGDSVSGSVTELGIGLTRDKMTNVYFSMLNKIKTLKQFLNYTLLTVLSLINGSVFKTIWDGLVSLAASILSGIVYVCSLTLTEHFKIPVKEICVMALNQSQDGVTTAIFNKYTDMVEKLQTHNPDSEILSFFKNWWTSTLSKIQFFDWSEIIINVNYIDLSKVPIKVPVKVPVKDTSQSTTELLFDFEPSPRAKDTTAPKPTVEANAAEDTSKTAATLMNPSAYRKPQLKCKITDTVEMLEQQIRKHFNIKDKYIILECNGTQLNQPDTLTQQLYTFNINNQATITVRPALGEEKVNIEKAVAEAEKWEKYKMEDGSIEYCKQIVCLAESPKDETAQLTLDTNFEQRKMDDGSTKWCMKDHINPDPASAPASAATTKEKICQPTPPPYFDFVNRHNIIINVVNISKTEPSLTQFKCKTTDTIYTLETNLKSKYKIKSDIVLLQGRRIVHHNGSNVLYNLPNIEKFVISKGNALAQEIKKKLSTGSEKVLTENETPDKLSTSKNILRTLGECNIKNGDTIIIKHMSDDEKKERERLLRDAKLWKLNRTVEGSFYYYKTDKLGKLRHKTFKVKIDDTIHEGWQLSRDTGIDADADGKVNVVKGNLSHSMLLTDLLSINKLTSASLPPTPSFEVPPYFDFVNKDNITIIFTFWDNPINNWKLEFKTTDTIKKVVEKILSSFKQKLDEKVCSNGIDLILNNQIKLNTCENLNFTLGDFWVKNWDSIFIRPTSNPTSEPLPTGWTEVKDCSGCNKIYQNEITGSTQSERPNAPAENPLKEVPNYNPTSEPLPEGWYEITDDNGSKSYMNVSTGETQLERPNAPVLTNDFINSGGNFRRMYDDQVLTQLYQTYKNKRLSKNDKSYVNNILSMIIQNVEPSDYTQSHKNILLLMFKD